MYIKQVVIDGFKSYAHRTEVGPFDPQFNAITGLNGSGKSNILDSICFLLGISNLSQVRAGSLQELVYKGGQAGVTKATVTIAFDNSNKKQSPVGYESFDEITVSRQVVIGGRNKYLINGTNAPPTRVQDLFRSVQLNVNNPHFLIMQGRITKVLNMKPQEILSMIEEAAGTRMYESKKASAQKTIEKKDSKLSEIDKVLTEEITPTLRQLKEERSSYLEYQKITRELEHLTRLVIAYNFIKAEEKKGQIVVDLDKVKSDIVQLKEESQQMEQSMSEIQDHIKTLQRQRQHKEAEDPLIELEKQVETTSKAVAVSNASLKNSQQQLATENKNHNEMKKVLKEDENLFIKKKEQVSSRQESFEALQLKLQNAQSALTESQKHFQAVSSGLSSTGDGQSETLAAQKITKVNEVTAAQTSIKQSVMKLKEMENLLKEQEATSKGSEKNYNSDKNGHEKIKKNISNIETSIKKLCYNEGEFEEMISKRDLLLQEIAGIKEKIATFESKYPYLQFEYTNPCVGFDKNNVKGSVAKLIKLKDTSTATALEVTAGGKLYQIVVSDEETGKQLLQRGQLKRRLTIIPLNKIISHKIPQDTVRKAQQLVGVDNARLALSLVDYNHDVKPAMEYAFGSTFICHTLSDAQKVTFHDKILSRSVALAGDVFDPSGTLTGGARPQVTALLLKLQEQAENEELLEIKMAALDQINRKIEQTKSKAQKFVELNEELNTKSHEAQIIWNRMEQSTHYQHLMQLQQLKDSIETERMTLEDAKKNEQLAKEQLKEIEYKMENAESHHEQELKQAEERLSKAKEEADKITDEAHKNSTAMEELQLEIKGLESSIDTQMSQIENILKVISDIQNQLSKNGSSLEQAKEEMNTAVNELDAYKAVLKERNKELQQQEKALKEMDVKKSDYLLKIKNNELKITSLVRESKEAEKKVEVLLSKYEWIATDRQYFGQPNTAYDFKAVDPKEAERKTTTLEQQKEKLKKSVNMRAMNMLGKAEEKYNDLMKKKKIVENDKAKISELITELDQKKNEALQTAWKRVNKDFGSIFSTLLPGTSAKLSPPQGLTVLDGLEVKVAFGDVWKESLTELSGGQRSLVALSLILSLLLFKPAPLYILDEVDAALDLSHTQNIGQMLRTHFHHSQFIVVSLKNGMFNNANVLFKTKFVDGVSTVTRYSTPQRQN